MPVRIYDISKKLGLENKEVLAKAKELGITAAKVPSSSLDKITAEYLEEKLTGGKPVAAPAPPPEPEKIILVTAPVLPPEPPPPVMEPAVESEVITEGMVAPPAPAPNGETTTIKVETTPSAPAPPPGTTGP